MEYKDFTPIHTNLETHPDKKGIRKYSENDYVGVCLAGPEGERIIPVRVELKLYKGLPKALYIDWSPRPLLKKTGTQQNKKAVGHRNTAMRTWENSTQRNCEVIEKREGFFLFVFISYNARYAK